MGFFPLSLTLLLAATPIPVDAPRLQDDAAPVLEQAMAPEAFEAVLLEGNIPALQLACADAAQFGLEERLRLLRNRLLVVAPAPQPFEVVMANARALMQCKAPDSVPVVLSRYGPAPGRSAGTGCCSPGRRQLRLWIRSGRSWPSCASLKGIPRDWKLKLSWWGWMRKGSH